jgi:hypothetical protein
MNGIYLTEEEAKKALERVTDVQKNKKPIVMYPKESIYLTEASPVMQRAVIAYFKQNGIPVKSSTNDYDPEYPYLMWDGPDAWLTQAVGVVYGHRTVENTEEFLDMFENKNKWVKLSDRYTAEVNYDKKTVKVGCQEFEFDRVLELADKIRKNDK